MSKMIQIRNVDDDVHRVLKTRAAAEGTSLSDYIKRELELMAARPTFEELNTRIKSRGRSNMTAESIVAGLREVRDA
jgi:antitoxin FitA